MWRLSAASEQRVPGEFSGVRLAPGEMSSCRSRHGESLRIELRFVHSEREPIGDQFLRAGLPD